MTNLTTTEIFDREALQKSACRKAAIRLVPILAIAYFFNYLDRTNVGFASLTMNEDLGLTASQFGFAAGIFYIGYCLFEVPSNLALYRFGARRWLARIMITWGLCSAATAFAQGPTSYAVIRLFAGIAEAGFFPGVIFFMSLWFPQQYRTRVMAWFLFAIPISSVLGGPLSAVMLEMNGIWGVTGWQWLLVLQGLPACVIGLVCLKMLADKPADAHWLTAREREALQSAIDAEHESKGTHSFRQSISDVRVWLLAAILFSYIIGILGIGVWLPQILKTHSLTTTQIGWVSAIPYLIASIAMLLWAKILARKRRYILHLAITCATGAAGFICSVVYSDLIPALIGLTVALIGLSSVRTCFYSIPATFLSKQAAAGGIAFINAVGSLGGLVGPYAVGVLKDVTHSFNAGLIGMAAMLCLATVLTLILRYIVKEA
ncbi:MULTISPECIES: MFS transporter [Pseudomonas]|uniref:MFS transporter n=1 Tax=Pseudomonas quercus TaxID=2722792 RepID=A0ABX0YFW0_9PSED|nr:MULTISPECIES: MFS transporter [Pseudomonas]MBF7143589.1 MFS transporter [Pseudomonas sp. LY10J]NJP02255.1 MFS transporter [Pseudomonas quercus]